MSAGGKPSKPSGTYLPLSLVLDVFALKKVMRTGWPALLEQLAERRESVAEHSFGVALLCMLFAREEKLDVNHCVMLALCHDLHEALCEDIPLKKLKSPADFVFKKKREREAFESLIARVPVHAKYVLNRYWQEFVEGRSKAAMFVHDMDRVDMAIQALLYARTTSQKQPFLEFIEYAKHRVKSQTAKRLIKDIEAQSRRID
jgi:putative hydrolase of HD superfamily